jgi:uncharacterized cofD-like protein
MVKGRVLPATDTRVVLVAEHPDGTKSTGEQRISRSSKPIIRMELRPGPPQVAEVIREAVRDADLIVLGPGSLYTSIIPNLLVPGMVEVLEEARARVVLVANLMTQPGETDGFHLREHLEALRDVGGLRRLDLVLAHEGGFPDAVLARYMETGADPASVGNGPLPLDPVIVEADIAVVNEDGKARHDAVRLSDVLFGLAAGGPAEGPDA